MPGDPSRDRNSEVILLTGREKGLWKIVLR